MQRYEADIRTHISVSYFWINYSQIEQQLKIYIDNIKYKLECQEKEEKIKLGELQGEITGLQHDKKRMDELLALKDKEIKNLNT